MTLIVPLRLPPPPAPHPHDAPPTYQASTLRTLRTLDPTIDLDPDPTLDPTIDLDPDHTLDPNIDLDPHHHPVPSWLLSPGLEWGSTQQIRDGGVA